MSRYARYICDVCGVEISAHSAQVFSQVSAQIKLCAPGESRTGYQRFDLCLDCYGRFVTFLETGRAEEGVVDVKEPEVTDAHIRQELKRIRGKGWVEDETT